MSGNVEEWSDACTHYVSPETIQNCCRPGGAFWMDSMGLTCGSHREAARSTLGATAGFRCCAGGG